MPLAQLLFYALPAIPIAAMTLPLYIIVPTFYSETLGLSLGAVGAALLAVRIMDAVSDPVIGWLSDRWRPAFGRRRGFFLMALPVAAISCVMLFWPPEKPGVLYLAFWGAVLSMGFTATQLSYTAWGAELAGNYRERSRIAGFREAFTLAGTLIAIVLPFAIGLEGGGLHGLAVLGLIVAAGLLVFGGLAVAKVPEPREYTISRLGIGEGLRHMARNGPFVRLIAAYFLNGLSNGIPATLFLYFVSERLGASDMRGPLLFVYFLAGLIGVPFAIKLASHAGKHRAWCYAMLLNSALFALVPLLGQAMSATSRRSASARASRSAPTWRCLRRSRPMSSTSTPRGPASSVRASISRRGACRPSCRWRSASASSSRCSACSASIRRRGRSTAPRRSPR